MADVSTRLLVKDLMATEEYQRLTPKQRLFVATYCEGGMLDGNYDSIAATRTAYQCKTPEVARIMSYSLMQNIRIVAALNRHFNRAPNEEFLIALDRAIVNKNLTMAQLGALRLKCEVMGLRTRISDKTSIGILPDDVIESEKQAKKNKRAKKEEPVASAAVKKSHYGF